MGTPDWLTQALAVKPETDRLTVAGCEIQRMMWGRRGDPGLILIHGGAAHTHWWSFLAPLLHGYRVAAMDLSGHGDSGRRADYQVSTWTKEVLACVVGADFGAPPVVIGHSMGGFVTVATAVAAGDDLAGIVILDSPMNREDPEVEAARLGQTFGAPKTYPDLETAISRFRTVPRQDHYEPAILDHVARHSLVEEPDGWRWKFDPRIFLAVSRSAAAEMLPEVDCRVALFRAQYGLVTPEIGDLIYERLGRVAPVVEIPQAGHHMMLDQPLMLVTALRTLLADWDHSVRLTR
jgi:pimeloyl-ACP methyl ester carboxylesterase